MRIPMLDIVNMHAPIRDELVAKLTEVLDSGSYIKGKYVAAFEEEFAAYVGGKRAVGVSSGTDALLVALMALGVKPGDEVITSAFTFFATAGAIARLDATPVFADIDPVTFNIDPGRIGEKVTGRTAGIVPVHLFGQSADMDKINAIAEKHGLWVLEDAAQSVGALYNGRMCGAMGTIGIYSFYPAKNLGAIGDAGAVVTDDEALGEKIALLRDHGQDPTYYYKMVGGNFRLDAIQAATLSVKLPHLKTWEEKRRRAAALYTELLAASELFVTPAELPGNRHVFNQFEIRVRDGKRDAAAAKLKEADIGCAVFYPVPLHLQECFADLGGREGHLPETELACEQVLALPVCVDEAVCREVVSILKTV